MKTDLKGLSARETEEWAVSHGLEPYRGKADPTLAYDKARRVI